MGRVMGMKMCRSNLFLAGVIMVFLAAGCRSMEKKQASPDPYENWQATAEQSSAVPSRTGDDTPVAGTEQKVSGPQPALVTASGTTDKTTPGVRNTGPDTPTADTPTADTTTADTSLKPDTARAAGKILPEMPLSMKMHDVSVAVLLRTLARAADMNIMINETVTGSANINIDNVPWDQAFKALLDTYGLAYKWSGDVLRIITVEDLNKEIALMEATQKFEKNKKEHAIAMLTIQQEQEKLDPLTTEIFKIDYANLEKLRDNIEHYLLADKKDLARAQTQTETGDKKDTSRKTELRGAILMDPGTSSLIIQATQSDLEKITPLIKKLDQPTFQILIEANIVEANSDTAKELGVQWGGLGVNMSGDKNTWLGGPVGTYDKSLFVSEDDATEDRPAGTPIIYQPPIGTAINFPSSENAGTAGWEGMTLGLLHQKIGSFLLTAQLTALEKQGKLKILSRPSITTMDNRKATIESGQEVPFQTIEDGEIKIEFKKAVIKLEVIPHVIDDDSIRLEIITNKDELDWTRTVLGNPTIITKNAQTEIFLQDGQTTVIGGLNKEKNLEAQAGVPFLKNLPGLGRLFRKDATSAEMEELLIFITPRILGAERRTAAALKKEN